MFKAEGGASWNCLGVNKNKSAFVYNAKATDGLKINVAQGSHGWEQ